MSINAPSSADFTNIPFIATNPGQVTGNLSNGFLVPNGGDILIDDAKSIGSVIPGISRIYITINPQGNIFQYTINVLGSAVALGRATLLSFSDQDTPVDTYQMFIINPFPTNHTVQYSSTAPNIVAIAWNVTGKQEDLQVEMLT